MLTRQPHMYKTCTFVLAALVAFYGLCCIPLTSWVYAQDPMKTSVLVSAGPRFFLGDIGAHTKRGLGLDVHQELRWDWFGVHATLGAAYFLTTQDTLPLSQELITYNIGLGVNTMWRSTNNFALFTTLGYERLGLASNSLVELTGPQISYHSGAVGAGVGWMYSNITVDLRIGYHHVFALPGSMLSISLTAGFTRL